MIKYLTLLTILVVTLSATVYDIHTQSLWGRVSAEAGDTLILHPNHPLVGKTPRNVTVVLCNTTACRVKVIAKAKYKYRTHGITIMEIK